LGEPQGIGDGWTVYNNARLVQIRGMSANVAATALQVMSSEEPLRNPFVVPYRRRQRNTIMDREHVKGAADKAKGAIKEGAGKLSGDKDMETEGKIDKAKGSAHNAAGDVKDAARDAADAIKK
jgi:uncharacterized protein YjbJ (UPF0337 family)